MMKYTKLIIIPWHVFDKRANLLYDLKSLITKPLELEYWDISPITGVEGLARDIINGVKLEVIRSLEDLRSLIGSQDPNKTLIILSVNYCISTYKIYEIISKSHISMAYFVSGALPMTRRSRVRRLLGSIFYNYLDLRRMKHNYHKWILHTNKLRYPDYWFKSCRESQMDYKRSRKTRIIPVSSFDYIDSRKIVNSRIQYKYVVFIDQCICDHPDADFLGLAKMNRTLYYNRLNVFFDLIEEKYECRVIIAAHPVSKSYQINNPFNGREVFYNKTKELVYDSFGVLSHFSTANSFAVLYNKPVILLISNEIIKYRTGGYWICQATSTELGCPMINVDSDHTIDEIEFQQPNPIFYNNYKYNYLTMPESENRNNGDIIMSVLQGEI